VSTSDEAPVASAIRDAGEWADCYLELMEFCRILVLHRADDPAGTAALRAQLEQFEERLAGWQQLGLKS
jgi:hypothetical protein